MSNVLALSILIGLIALAIPAAAFGLSSSLGRVKGKPVTLRDCFRMHYNINFLSAARLFLFGARCALLADTSSARHLRAAQLCAQTCADRAVLGNSTQLQSA